MAPLADVGNERINKHEHLRGQAAMAGIEGVDVDAVDRLIEKGADQRASLTSSENASGVAMQQLARIGQTGRLTPDDAKAHFGGLAMFVGGDGPASNDKTRAALGWVPKEADIIADIERPDYSE